MARRNARVSPGVNCFFVCLAIKSPAGKSESFGLLVETIAFQWELRASRHAAIVVIFLSLSLRVSVDRERTLSLSSLCCWLAREKSINARAARPLSNSSVYIPSLSLFKGQSLPLSKPNYLSPAMRLANVQE